MNLGYDVSYPPELIPQTNFGNLTVFKPDAVHAKRWNNDNQPHLETWPRL
jgi:hypothetical protein